MRTEPAIWRMNRHLPIVCGLLCCLSARADIAPLPVSGGVTLSPASADKTKVAMTSQKVRISVAPGQCDVVAEFTLENTGDAQTLEIGLSYHYPEELKQFKAWVDGVPVAVTDAKRKEPGQSEQFARTESWLLWDMSFQDRQKRTVKVTYSTVPQKDYDTHLPGGAMTSPKVPYPQIPQKWYNLEDSTLLSKAAPALDVIYTLGMARPWKESTASCVVEFDCSKMGGWKIEPSPGGTTTASTYAWKMDKYGPNDEIRLHFSQTISAEDRANAYTKIALRHAEDFAYCDKTVAALLDMDKEAQAAQVARASLSMWKDSDAAVTKFDWGQVEPQYFGALKMAHQAMEAADKAGDKENALAFAKVARKILNAELALLPVDDRGSSRGWPFDGVIALCDKYNAR